MKPRIAPSRKRWIWAVIAVAITLGVVFVAGRSRATPAPPPTAPSVRGHKRPPGVGGPGTGRPRAPANAAPLRSSRRLVRLA